MTLGDERLLVPRSDDFGEGNIPHGAGAAKQKTINHKPQTKDNHPALGGSNQTKKNINKRKH